MNLTLYKILVLGIPALILVIGLTFGIWFIVKSTREEKRNKAAISGFVFYHPLRQAEEGCFGKLIDHEQKTNWPTPTGSPFWHRFKWYLPKTPFFFFQQELDTPEAINPEPTTYKCLCGFEDANPRVLHGHTLWNPHRKVDGKPIVKEEWEKLHKKVFTEAKSEVTAIKSDAKYHYANFEPSGVADDILLTPFDIFDLNNWECQRDFHKKKAGIREAITLGAGVVLAVVCLFVSFVVISEVQKKPPTQPTNATIEVTK